MARTNVGTAAKTSVRRIRTTEKTLKALELRKRGLNYTQIGKKLGATGAPPAAMSCQNWKTRRQMPGGGRARRDLELQRLDDLYLIAYRAIIGGNSLAGIDAVSASWSADQSSSGSTLLRRSNIPATS